MEQALPSCLVFLRKFRDQGLEKSNQLGLERLVVDDIVFNHLASTKLLFESIDQKQGLVFDACIPTAEVVGIATPLSQPLHLAPMQQAIRLPDDLSQ